MGLVDVVSILLAHGADVNLKNDEGVMLLMMSCHKGHAEIVELLLDKYKADLTAITNTGMTASDFGEDKAISLYLENTGTSHNWENKQIYARPYSNKSTSHSVQHERSSGLRNASETLESNSDKKIDGLLYFEPGNTPELPTGCIMTFPPTGKQSYKFQATERNLWQ